MPKLHIGPISIAPNVWQAAAIIALIFVFVLVLAYMSHNFMEWSLSGAGIGLVVGFILALVLEGFLIVGARTVITVTLGCKNDHAPIQRGLTEVHQKLIEYLYSPSSCS